jgi:hypothetical protein
MINSAVTSVHLLVTVFYPIPFCHCSYDTSNIYSLNDYFAYTSTYGRGCIVVTYSKCDDSL